MASANPAQGSPVVRVLQTPEGAATDRQVRGTARAAVLISGCREIIPRIGCSVLPRVPDVHWRQAEIRLRFAFEVAMAVRALVIFGSGQHVVAGPDEHGCHSVCLDDSRFHQGLQLQSFLIQCGSVHAFMLSLVLDAAVTPVIRCS